jgi:hypothetical protein
LQIQLLDDAAMARQIELHFVLARLEVQTLERAVEVVDDTRIVAVDEHLRLTR